jgi:hypothetical protein
MTNREWTGVWLSNRPLDINEGVGGDRVLVIDMPEQVAVEWEWVQPGLGYREFLVPAAAVNRYGASAPGVR